MILNKLVIEFMQRCHICLLKYSLLCLSVWTDIQGGLLNQFMDLASCTRFWSYLNSAVWTSEYWIWMEAFLAYVKVPLQSCLQVLSKIMETSFRIGSSPAEIWTRYFLNTSLEHYHYSSQLVTNWVVFILLW
jgi:hypothetical protein